MHQPLQPQWEHILKREFEEAIDSGHLTEFEKKVYLDDINDTMENLRHRKD